MNDQEYLADISEKVLITGAAGFLGTNLALRLISHGGQPLLVDNLSRSGSEKNLQSIRRAGGNRFVKADLSEAATAAGILADNPNIEIIFHLAGQTAVTVSMIDPLRDFNDNILASVNLMKAAAEMAAKPLIVFSSSNKVYGPLEDVEVVEGETRYSFKDISTGIAEKRQMVLTDSIYSLSKGTVEMMLSVFGRQSGLRSIVLRQSCIYGPHQCGYADQGWVFWFIHCLFNGLPITVYGDGKQVRDILFVEDYVDLLIEIVKQRELAAGCTFNVGGGGERSISLLELLDLLSLKMAVKPQLVFEDSRIGDQKVFISDISEVTNVLGWRPQNSIESGLEKTIAWLEQTANRA